MSVLGWAMVLDQKLLHPQAFELFVKSIEVSKRTDGLLKDYDSFLFH